MKELFGLLWLSASTPVNSVWCIYISWAKFRWSRLRNGWVAVVMCGGKAKSRIRTQVFHPSICTLLNHYPDGSKSLKPGWVLSKDCRILMPKLIISMSLKVNKNILSAVGITHPKCRIDNLLECSSELFLAKQTLRTNSVRISWYWEHPQWCL